MLIFKMATINFYATDLFSIIEDSHMHFWIVNRILFYSIDIYV